MEKEIKPQYKPPLLSTCSGKYALEILRFFNLLNLIDETYEKPSRLLSILLRLMFKEDRTGEVSEKTIPTVMASKEISSERQKELIVKEGIVEERRHFPRTDEIIDVAFQDTESFKKAYIVNVSGGGLFIKTEEPIELNEYMQVRFYLPNDKEPIIAEGKVVWVTPKGIKNHAYLGGFGLKFIYIKPDDKKRLGDFVSHEISKYF